MDELEAAKEADAQYVSRGTEYMMADEAYDVRGFADDEPSDNDDYVDHGGWDC